MLLTKSDYILYRECHKNAWMKIHEPEIFYKSELSEFEKSIIETGNEVELLARKLFPSGILIEGRDEKAQKDTQDFLKSNKPVLFQPIFIKDGFLAAVDILERDEDGGYIIYEVKATNAVKEKIHFYDLAFQVNLLKKFGLKINKIKIIHLNSEYIRSGDLDMKKLFLTDDATKEIEEILDNVSAEMDLALDYLSKDSEPAGACCCICKGRSNHCATFRHSNPDVPEYSIHDIARIGSSKKKMEELIDNHLFHIHEIPEHIELSDIQRNQVNAHVFDKILIERELIAKEFEKLVFPLYFLDYETFPSAVPRFDGYSPYQQIPFQYSLHILKSPKDKPEHLEFLYVGDREYSRTVADPESLVSTRDSQYFRGIELNDPSKPLAESLQKNIGDSGSVIVWNKKFECKINQEIGERFPEFREYMEAVNHRVFDLMDIFSKQFYVHKHFRGSTSIKCVLPTLVPELSYKDLHIQEGGTASQSWNKITTPSGGTLGISDAPIDKAEKDKIAKDLLDYCELDTYAMYAIWKHLRELI